MRQGCEEFGSSSNSSQRLERSRTFAPLAMAATGCPAGDLHCDGDGAMHEAQLKPNEATSGPPKGSAGRSRAFVQPQVNAHIIAQAVRAQAIQRSFPDSFSRRDSVESRSSASTAAEPFPSRSNESSAEFLSV
jgi:hypothetical protein